MDPRLHDSNFTGIAVLRADDRDEERDIRLSFESENGECFNVTLHSCKLFRCDNFRQGNVVFELSELKADKVSRHDVERLVCLDDVEYVRNLNEERLTEDTDKIFDLIRSRKMKFIKMGSSYGAELFALCKEAKVTGS